MTGEARQRQALGHIWPHSNELEWDELLGPGGLCYFVKGEKSTLTDIDGREYLDALAGLFLVNIGHGRSEVGEAMARQARQLAYTASSNTVNSANVALADTLATLTPGDLDRFFFCSSGSEATETALKIAKQAQVLRGYPKRYKVIARRGSYHGTTAGAMGLTASASEKFFGPFLYGVSKVPSPNHYRNDFDEEGEKGDLLCARALEQEILAQGAEHVAAFIAEPISAANGTHIPSPAYFQEVRRICDRYGVFLIMDEVITGFGRTGKMFAAEHMDVVPDLMTMAKGISSGYAPVGAVAVRSPIFESFTEHGNAFSHLLTFGGHAVAAAAAVENIRILQDEQLPDRSAELGRYLFEIARDLLAHPTVGDVRGGSGLLLGVELVKSKSSKANWGTTHPFIKRLGARMQESGIVTRIWDVVHIAPPLVVERSELERIVETVDRCLTEVEAEFASEIE